MIPVIGLPVTYNLVLGSVAIPRARGDGTADLWVLGYNVGADLNISGITSAGRRSAEALQLRKRQNTREGQREPGRQRKQQEE